MRHNLYYRDNENRITLLTSDKCFSKKNQFNRENLFSFSYTGQMIKEEFAKTSQITFEVTEKCNLQCTYCTYSNFYTDHTDRKFEDLTFNKAKNLIDFYIEIRNSIYSSHKIPLTMGFYGGEPLLNFDLIYKIINYSENKIPDLSFAMTTNGVLLHKYIDYLKEKKFKLLISLDGDKEGNGYRIKPNGQSSFKEIFKNAKRLASIYPEYFKSNVNFNCVLHNKNSADEAFNFFKKEFDKIPRFNEISLDHLNENKRKELETLYKSQSLSIKEALVKNKTLNELEIVSPEHFSLNSFLNKDSGNVFRSYPDLLFNSKKVPLGTCLPFSRKIYLTVEGKTLPCERIGNLFNFGIVKENSIDIDFEKIATIYNSLYQSIKNRCLKCAFLLDCPKCIFRLKISKSFKILACDEFVKNENNKDVDMLSKMSLLETKPYLYNHFLENMIIE